MPAIVALLGPVLHLGRWPSKPQPACLPQPGPACSPVRTTHSLTTRPTNFGWRQEREPQACRPGCARHPYRHVGTLVTRQMAMLHIPGLFVVIIRDGQVVGKGYAATGRPHPVGIDTPFVLDRRASSSPGLAVQQFAVEKALDLDLPVPKVFPAFGGHSVPVSRITARILLGLQQTPKWLLGCMEPWRDCPPDLQSSSLARRSKVLPPAGRAGTRHQGVARMLQRVCREGRRAPAAGGGGEPERGVRTVGQAVSRRQRLPVLRVWRHRGPTSPVRPPAPASRDCRRRLLKVRL